MRGILLLWVLILSACVEKSLHTIKEEATPLPAPTPLPSYLNLMPVPASVQIKPGKFRLSDDFRVAITGRPHRRIYGATNRFLRRLDGRTGIFLKQGLVIPTEDPGPANIIITVKRPGKVRLHENESYTLAIRENNIELQADTDIGALRGLETLLQLVDVDKQGYFFPSLIIEDQPRFPWRGLLIDVGRHFMPMEVLKRNLDGMAAVKMNVFHWHLTEDQGFRVECKKYPKLHQRGSDGQYYTHEQIKEIVSYAADRGIRVVPEFDVPGHATSWLVGYPRIGSAPGPYQLERKFGIFDPTLDPTQDLTYNFLNNVIKEMITLFPDQYFHIGGDEVTGKHWDSNPRIQRFMRSKKIPHNHALQSYFNRGVQKILEKNGRKMVGWDEVLQPDMPKSIIIQSWRGKESLYDAVHQGYQVILSNGYYINLMRPTDHHYLNDPLPTETDWTDEQKKYVLGGEATMWSEHVTPETIDSRIWPRTAAIAERLWSPQHIRNVRDMYNRLGNLSIRLEELGLTHIKNRDLILRRLTGGKDIKSLQILVDVIEPVKGNERNADGSYSVFSPYTMVVDAATADAALARNFRYWVDDFLESPSEPKSFRIKQWLEQWQQNHEKLIPVINKFPVLTETRSLSQNLSNLGELGLETFKFLKDSIRPDKTWRDQALTFIKEAKTPYAKTEIKIVNAVKKLVLNTDKLKTAVKQTSGL